MKVLAESVSGHGPRPWFLNGCLCLFSAARTEYHGLDRIPFIKEKNVFLTVLQVAKTNTKVPGPGEGLFAVSYCAQKACTHRRITNLSHPQRVNPLTRAACQ